MMTELLAAAIRANLAASGAIIAVALARPMIRRTFGPRISSWLWSAPLVAALGSMIPRYDSQARLASSPCQPISQLEQLVFAIWVMGVALAATYVTLLQLRFTRDQREGRAGPAVVGILCPRIVMPRNAPFSADERKLVRLHEQEHIRRKDPLMRALITVCQCLCWFNPVIHLAAGAARLDQELACDAEVVRRFPSRRRTYAEALLTSMALEHGGLGCHWIAAGRHPLETRVAALRSPNRREAWRLWGLTLVASLTAASGVLTWKTVPATRPPPPFVWPGNPPILVLVDIVPRDAPGGAAKTSDAFPSR